MAREATVVLRIREEDARWLFEKLAALIEPSEQEYRIERELRHALAECDCGEEAR